MVAMNQQLIDINQKLSSEMSEMIEVQKATLKIREELTAQVSSLAKQNEALTFQLAQLKRMLFGAKSERFVPASTPGQLSLDIIAEENEPEEQEVVHIEAHDRKKKKDKKEKHPVRMPFPDHLVREDIIIEPTEDTTGCKKIGEEITEELEYIEAKVFVKRFIRIKYAPADNSAVYIAPVPTRVIDKGLFGPNLITQIIIDKYVDHLPLYRQAARYERAGVKLALSTLSDTVAKVCELMYPLYECLRDTILQGDYLQVDETPIQVMDRATKGKTHRGFHWVYHAPKQKLVLFDYRIGRGREGPEDLLKNYNGYLQTDGYSVYDAFARRKGITAMGCMAHARRYFEKALSNDRARAEFALGKIQDLYQIECSLREQNCSADEIVQRRKAEVLPILIELENWMKSNLHHVLQSTPIGQAICYALPRWDSLSVYIEHADLCIDNNLIENAIRPVAIGRKNYLFAGSHEGAKRAAIIYAFLGSCKMNDINPQQWLSDILIRIADTKTSQLRNLLPDRWKKPA